MVKGLPADAGETGSIPGPRGSHRPQALRMMSSCQWARLLSGDLDKSPLAKHSNSGSNPVASICRTKGLTSLLAVESGISGYLLSFSPGLLHPQPAASHQIIPSLQI